MLKSVVTLMLLFGFIVYIAPHTVKAAHNGIVQVNGRVQVFTYSGTYCYSYDSVWGYPDTTTTHYGKWHKGKPLPPGELWTQHQNGHGATVTRTRFATSRASYPECPPQ